MKLRIQDNSIRFRLSKEDVASLVDQGNISSVCHMATGGLRYQVVKGDRSEMKVDFVDSQISATVPALWIKNWVENDIVGFDGTDTNGLYILIEKDFQCLKPRAQEDESGLYTNPQSHLQ